MSGLPEEGLLVHSDGERILVEAERRGVYSLCGTGSCLVRGGAWPVGVDHGLGLGRAGMGEVGWICGVGLSEGKRGGNSGGALGVGAGKFDDRGGWVGIVWTCWAGGWWWLGWALYGWMGGRLGELDGGHPGGGLVGLCWG